MKKLLLVLALCLASLPLRAQTQVTPAYATSFTGTLTTSGDAVQIALAGGAWATAQFQVTTAGTATITTQISLDGGVNWLGSAMAKQLNLVTASPTVQAISASTLTASSWEVPLPSNSTHFRLLCAGTGTVNSVLVRGGMPYTPGMPVTGILFDVSGAGIIDTGILDVSGWGSAMAVLNNSAAALVNNFSIGEVDDAGVQTSTGGTGGIFVSPVAAGAASYRVELGLGIPPAAPISTVGTSIVSSGSILPRRLEIVTLALATNRVRFLVRR